MATTRLPCDNGLEVDVSIQQITKDNVTESVQCAFERLTNAVLCFPETCSDVQATLGDLQRAVSCDTGWISLSCLTMIASKYRAIVIRADRSQAVRLAIVGMTEHELLVRKLEKSLFTK